MVLLVHYYREGNSERQKEIDECFERNVKSRLFKRIVVFSSESILPFRGHQCDIVPIERPTYRELFTYANKHLATQICIIANSDIFFGPTLINHIEKLSTNELWALTRWQYYDRYKVIFYGRAQSQDAWIFYAPVADLDSIVCDYPLGKPGCDNRIAFEFAKVGYKVSNPSKSIRVYHLHNSGVRHYSQADRIPRPYLFLDPHKLEK